jgi:hypothetical protein
VGAADFDKDGDLDLIFEDARKVSSLSFLENDGLGNPRGLSLYPVIEDRPKGFRRHVLTDMNGDGKIDIVFGEATEGNIYWLENQGRPKFKPNWKQHVISKGGFKSTYDYAVEDFDGDGDLDVAATAYKAGEVAWFENDGTPQGGRPWKMHEIADDLDEVRCLRSADFDGDGDKDLLVTARLLGEVQWYENSGQPAKDGWTVHVIDAEALHATHGTPCDMDRDGDSDIVMSIGFGVEEDDRVVHEVVWYENTGSPQDAPWPKHRIAVLLQAFDAIPADLDGDGDLDIIASGWSELGRVVWCENPGDPHGEWTKHILKEGWKNANQVIAADFNNDGRLDIAATSDQDRNQLVWWINQGRR